MTAVGARQAPGTPALVGPDDHALLRVAHDRLLRAHDPRDLAGAEPDQLRAMIAEVVREVAPLLPRGRHERAVGALVHEVVGLGPLEPLLADPAVTEVMVNGPDRCFVEREGRLEAVTVRLDAVEITRLVERVIAPLGLRLDRASPMVDARLPDGSRLHAVLPPLAVDGPYVTIRRFGAGERSLAEFGVSGCGADFLRWAVHAGWNLVVAGGTSSGKTTLLNTLAAEVDPSARVVTIEETAELRLAQPHVVRLEARPANAEGVGAVVVRDLVRAALRMRPDRIVLGEVRGGEAFDMLQALNTGHDGSLCTVHANGASEALRRIETLALLAGVALPLSALRNQLATALDAVVVVARLQGGQRRVQAIAEVQVLDEMPVARPLFAARDGGLVALRGARRPPRCHGAPLGTGSP